MLLRDEDLRLVLLVDEPKPKMGEEVIADETCVPTADRLVYCPGPGGAFPGFELKLKRWAVPNAHLGADLAGDETCSPTALFRLYCGPGVTTEPTWSLECSWLTKTFSCPARVPLPKPYDGADLRREVVWLPKVVRVPPTAAMRV